MNPQTHLNPVFVKEEGELLIPYQIRRAEVGKLTTDVWDSPYLIRDFTKHARQIRDYELLSDKKSIHTAITERFDADIRQYLEMRTGNKKAVSEYDILQDFRLASQSDAIGIVQQQYFVRHKIPLLQQLDFDTEPIVRGSEICFTFYFSDISPEKGLITKVWGKDLPK